MRPLHHPDEATLVSYSAGALPTAFAVLVSAHLGICRHCREQLLDADRTGGMLMQQREPAPLSAGARDRMLARLGETRPDPPPLHRVPVVADPDCLPAPLQPYFGATYGDLRWRMIAPGVHRILADGVTGGTLMLLRIAPGRRVPMHGHAANELTLVLQGAYDDALGHFAPGDVADLDDEIEHQPVTAPGVPCICAAATDAPLRFSGRFARLLQPLIRF
ncbi:MAG: transcriptional regulator [Rhodanobacteraceae bacterium]|jgi:putative transcriptional regulator|nr:transcriptional regulator [Rhodanobacteraceae bacterium]